MMRMAAKIIAFKDAPIPVYIPEKVQMVTERERKELRYDSAINHSKIAAQLQIRSLSTVAIKKTVYRKILNDTERSPIDDNERIRKAPSERNKINATEKLSYEF